jgi:hypothetical protein
MLTRRASTVFLVVIGFVMLSALANSGVTRVVTTGTVAAFKAGESITVTNDGMDPHPIALRDTTAYEGNPAAVNPGARVTVWYKYVGESRPVADRIRVLDPAAP